jgi:hypothetical protein
MMDMGIGAIFGAAGSIGGALINAEEQEENRQMNWAIAIMNYQQRERERTEQIAMANKLRKEQQLGSTDIRGTRTKFVPGVGWTTTGSPEVLAMMKAQDQEQMRSIEDLKQRRTDIQRNRQRSFADENTADTLKRMFTNQLAKGPASDEAYANDLLQAQNMGLAEANRVSGGRAYTQAFRTGNNSNIPKIAGELAKVNNAAYAEAALKSRLMSHGIGAKEDAEKRSGLANLYNMFATRAGVLPDVSYKPQAIDTSGTLGPSMQGALQAGALAANSYGKKGGELDYMSPNFGVGNAIAGGASALGSAFSAMGAKNAYDNRSGVSGVGGTGYSGGGSDMYTRDERDSE